MRPLPPQLRSWLPQLLDRDEGAPGDCDMFLDELSDGFLLVQVLGLLDPSSVDLAWYLTDEATRCADLHGENHRILAAGVRRAAIVGVTDADLDRARDGDLDACAVIAEAIWNTLGNRDGADGLGDSVAEENFEGDGVGDTMAMDLLTGLVGAPEMSFKAMLRGGGQQQAFDQSETPIEIGNFASRIPSPKPAWQLSPRHPSRPPSSVLLGAFSSSRTPTPCATSAQVDKATGEARGNDCDDYEPAESAFAAEVRWVLAECAKVAGSTQYVDIMGAEDLNSLLRNMRAKPYAILCSALATASKGSTVSSAASSGSQFAFIDELASRDLLCFSSSMKDSIADMVADRCPFYESIHSNIIEALAQWSCGELTLDLVLAHCWQQLGLPPRASRPFDLEDGLLCWIRTSNRFHAKLTAEIRSPFDGATGGAGDLVLDLRDGRALCGLAACYGLPIDLQRVVWDGPGHSPLEPSVRRQNLEAFDDACVAGAATHGVERPPWTPGEFAGRDGGGDDDDASRAETTVTGFRMGWQSESNAFRPIVVAYVSRLFEWLRSPAKNDHAENDAPDLQELHVEEAKEKPSTNDDNSSVEGRETEHGTTTAVAASPDADYMAVYTSDHRKRGGMVPTRPTDSAVAHLNGGGSRRAANTLEQYSNSTSSPTDACPMASEDLLAPAAERKRQESDAPQPQIPLEPQRPTVAQLDANPTSTQVTDGKNVACSDVPVLDNSAPEGNSEESSQDSVFIQIVDQAEPPPSAAPVSAAPLVPPSDGSQPEAPSQRRRGGNKIADNTRPRPAAANGLVQAGAPEPITTTAAAAAAAEPPGHGVRDCGKIQGLTVAPTATKTVAAPERPSTPAPRSAKKRPQPTDTRRAPAAGRAAPAALPPFDGAVGGPLRDSANQKDSVAPAMVVHRGSGNGSVARDLDGINIGGGEGGGGISDSPGSTSNASRKRPPEPPRGPTPQPPPSRDRRRKLREKPRGALPAPALSPIVRLGEAATRAASPAASAQSTPITTGSANVETDPPIIQTVPSSLAIRPPSGQGLPSSSFVSGRLPAATATMTRRNTASGGAETADSAGQLRLPGLAVKREDVVGRGGEPLRCFRRATAATEWLQLPTLAHPAARPPSVCTASSTRPLSRLRPSTSVGWLTPASGAAGEPNDDDCVHAVGDGDGGIGSEYEDVPEADGTSRAEAKAAQQARRRARIVRRQLRLLQKRRIAASTTAVATVLSAAITGPAAADVAASWRADRTVVIPREPFPGRSPLDPAVTVRGTTTASGVNVNDGGHNQDDDDGDSSEDGGAAPDYEPPRVARFLHAGHGNDDLDDFEEDDTDDDALAPLRLPRRTSNIKATARSGSWRPAAPLASIPAVYARQRLPLPPLPTPPQWQQQQEQQPPLPAAKTARALPLAARALSTSSSPLHSSSSDESDDAPPAWRVVRRQRQQQQHQLQKASTPRIRASFRTSASDLGPPPEAPATAAAVGQRRERTAAAAGGVLRRGQQGQGPPSNRGAVLQALRSVCLAGRVNARLLEEVAKVR
ncbi:hypothetical protein HK405_004547 [Cladochytrium tenue]|nr:hypothetical protein HK405_004547 [Cladochytrium tenue]